MTKIAINNVVREMTAKEQAAHNARQQAYIDDGVNRKLTEIKQIRLQKLNETDYMANSDYTMPDDVKTWRQTMRDIPANYTTETKYDELLATDEDNKLTHSVWSK